MGFWELLVVLVVVLLFFGAGKLPAIGEGLGKAIRGFRDSVRSEPSAPPAPQAPQKELPPGDGAGR
jgi:sec-independent protein translocase protein TatA